MEDNGRFHRAVRVLLRAQFASSVGDGAFYVTSALYLTTVAGLDPVQVGAGLSCAWTLGFLVSAPLGSVADRLGLRRSAIALAAATAVTLCALTGARSYPGFLLAVGGYAVAQSGLTAVRQALLVRLVPAGQRVLTRARMQVTTNAAVGLGAVVGGLALVAGKPAAMVSVLLGDAATFLVAGLLLLQLPEPATPHQVRHGRPGLPALLTVLADRRFVVATALNVVLYLYMPVLSVVIPLWVVDRTAAPRWIVAAVFVLNTAGVLVAQRAAATGVTGLRTAARSVRRGGLLLAAGCLGLWAASVPGRPAPAALALLVAGAVLTAGEVLLAAGSWEIGYGLADPERPGQWQGLYSSSVPAARALGPTALVGLVLVWTGPGWLVLSAALSLAGLALAATATARRATPDGRNDHGR